MGALVMAWLVGEGILIYRSVKAQKCPPGPGQLLYTSGIFVLLALLAESEKARVLAVTLAWGFDIAAFMRLFDGTILQDAFAAGAKAGITGSTGIGTWPPPQLPDTVIFPSSTPPAKPASTTSTNLPQQV
jgi:hypothetical protein